VQPVRIMSIKNSNDTIGNRSRDLPVCSAVPQPLSHRVLSTYSSSQNSSFMFTHSGTISLEYRLIADVWTQQITSMSNLNNYIFYKQILKILIISF
jgi:hypothetical protein